VYRVMTWVHASGWGDVLREKTWGAGRAGGVFAALIARRRIQASQDEH